MSNRGRVFSKKIEIDGVIFDSEMEGARYVELRDLQKDGKIRDLTLQPSFPLIGEVTKHEPLTGKGKTFSKMSYVADFQYIRVSDNVEIIEDVKGFMFDEFIIKQKLFEHLYPDKTISLVVQANKSLGFMEYNENIQRKKDNKNAKKDKEREARKALTRARNLKKRKKTLLDRVVELNQKSKTETLTKTELNRIEKIESELVPEINKELNEILS